MGKCHFIIGDLSAGFACKVGELSYDIGKGFLDKARFVQDVSFEKKYYRDTRPTVLVSPEVLFTLDQETVTIVAHAEVNL